MRGTTLLLLASACGPVAPPPAPPANAATGVGPEVWVYRELETGPARATSRVDTYRLERDGEQAMLTVLAQVSDEGGAAAEHLAVWRDDGTRRFAGRVRAADDDLLVDLHEDGSEVVWRWRCGLRTYQVAPADAVRRPPSAAMQTAAPGAAPGPCTDEGTWSATPAAVDTFTCGNRDRAADQLEGVFPFAREPGIEHLSITGDCAQGAGLRFIPAGGAIAPIRSLAP